MKKQKSNFVKLSDGQNFSGTIKGFGKNSYGVFIVTEKGNLSIKATVLQNIVKANINDFKVGAKIEVEKNAVEGKRYFNYTVSIDGKELSSQKESENISELF